MSLFPGNIQELIGQAQKLQEDVKRAQEEAGKKEIEASAGGGMVTVKVTGQQQITALHIDPLVLESHDREMLQDLVRAAVNEGIRKSREMMKEEMQKVTGNLPLPGIFDKMFS